MKDILLVYLLWKSNKNAMWLLNSMCSRGASPKTVLASNRHMLLLRVAIHWIIPLRLLLFFLSDFSLYFTGHNYGKLSPTATRRMRKWGAYIFSSAFSFSFFKKNFIVI